MRIVKNDNFRINQMIFFALMVLIFNDQILFINYKIIKLMGNQAGKQNTAEPAQKIVLRLRSRDIILHYGFKMKVTISDIDMFPHQLEGLKLWDIDIIISRYIILESQKFKNKSVLVFKGGVGIAAIALRKWTDAKDVAICDFRGEVLGNIKKNCTINDAKGVNVFKINIEQMMKSEIQYDSIICPDLLTLGFHPELIVGLFSKLLKKGGQGIIIMPEKKQQAKKILQVVNKKEFKITNLILTAEQYESNALFNRLESQKQFPQLGKINFYAISFIKIDHFQNISKLPQKEQRKFPIKEQIKQEDKKSKIIQKQIPRPIKIVEVKVQKPEQNNQQQNQSKEVDKKQQQKEQTKQKVIRKAQIQNGDQL